MKKPFMELKWASNPEELHLFEVNDEYRLVSDFASLPEMLSGFAEEKTAATCWRREAPPRRRIAETDRLDTLCIFRRRAELQWCEREREREKGFWVSGEGGVEQMEWREGFSRVQWGVWEGSGYDDNRC